MRGGTQVPLDLLGHSKLCALKPYEMHSCPTLHSVGVLLWGLCIQELWRLLLRTPNGEQDVVCYFVMAVLPFPTENPNLEILPS